MDPNVVGMADFDSLDPEEELICPYNPFHKLPAKGFPYHLMKCRKNWRGRPMLTCAFNARHVVPASEHRHHIATCPDKKCIEADVSYQQRKDGMHTSGMNTKGCTDLPKYDRKLPSPTEDWDDECSADEESTGYNPEDNPNAAVFQNLTGYSTAEKRQFHNSIGAVHFKTQADFDAHKPRDAIHQPHDQPQSTASVPGELQPFGTANQQTQVRLPRQPAKAAGMMASASKSSSQSSPSKRGGRIAANIFTTGETNGGMASGAAFVPQPIMSKPLLATTEINDGQHPSAFYRPSVGIGRGQVPGLGYGMVPGVGRGFVKNNTLMTQRELQK